MTRARAMTVGGLAQYATLQAMIGAQLAMAPMPRDVPRHELIENRGQAMPKGAQLAARGSRRDGRSRKAKAVAALVEVSNATLVVAHLHPRWLRRAVEQMMDAGANIDMAAVDVLREAGPHGAQMVVEAYRG